MNGSDISISIQAHLVAHRGKLLSGDVSRGTPVYAASFIRQRRIVLEESLLGHEQAWHFILAHELFHFVWVRLSNLQREQYGALLHHERQRRARGELGESSEVQQTLLSIGIEFHPKWCRDYVCESFCDTAAWIYTGFRHGSSRLRPRWRERRRNWFTSVFADGCRC